MPHMRIVRSLRHFSRLLSSIEIWVVTIAALASAGPMILLPIVFAIITSFWMIRWIAFGKPTLCTPIDFSLFLLILMIPVSLSVSAVRETTYVQILRLLIGIGLFYTIVNWATSVSRVKVVTYGAVLVCAAVAMSAPLSMPTRLTTFYHNALITADPSLEKFIVLSANTSNPNVIAGTLVILLPFPISLLIFAGRRLGWLLYAATAMAVAGSAFILVLTYSRGAQLGLGAAVLVLLMLKWNRTRWVLLVGVLISGIVAVMYQGVSTRAASAIGLDERFELWARASFMIEDFPLTGIGMGSFPDTVSQLYPLSLVTAQNDHAHNLFLQVAVDLGVPGLVVWIAMSLTIVSCSWQTYRDGDRNNNVWARTIGAGCISSQIALMVHGLTDAVVWGMVRTAFVPFAVWGITVANWLTHKAIRVKS